MNSLAALTTWIAGNTMVVSAQKGFGIGRDAYVQLEPKMTVAPRNAIEAYAQATYFVALAARRAEQTEETIAGNRLLTDLEKLLDETEKTKEGVNVVCSWTGYLCPGGAAGILQRAIDAVESSGLNVDDRVRIVTILRANRWSVQVKSTVPYLMLAGVGIVAGAWWYRRSASLM